MYRSSFGLFITLNVLELFMSEVTKLRTRVYSKYAPAFLRKVSSIILDCNVLKYS